MDRLISLRSSIPLHSLSSPVFVKFAEFYDKNRDSSWLQNRVFKSLYIDCTKMVDPVEAAGDYDPCFRFAYDGHTLPLNFVRYLESVTISYLDYWPGHADSVETPKALTILVLDQSETFPNLRRVRIIAGEHSYQWYQAKCLRQLMCRSAVEFFECDLRLTSGVSDFDLGDCEWAGNLKGIAFDSHDQTLNERDPIYQKVYSKISHKLESLHLVDPKVINDIDGKLENLQELCICVSEKKKVKYKDYRILLKQNMGNLQRLHLNLNFWTKKKAQRGLIEKALDKLEYLCITFRDEEVYWIEKALYRALKTMNAVDRAFKLRINHRCWYEKQLNDREVERFFETIHGLLTLFDFTFGDWMVIISDLSIEVKSEKELRNKHPVSKICDDHQVTMKMSNHKLDVVISNNGCKISGIQEQWMMRCKQCQESQKVIML